MAGDWIPAEVGLSRKREVVDVARATGRSRHEVAGLLVDFWGWASGETADGLLERLQVCDLVSLIGGDDPFWRAVISAGWLHESAAGLTIPNAQRWITKGAKSRLQKKNRQNRWRDGRREGDAERDATADTQGDVTASTGASTREEKRRVKRNPLTPTVEFTNFWERYPSKKKKPKALIAWRRVATDPETVAAIMAGLERHRASQEWAKNDGQFIPHPASWLNDRGWEDEVRPAVPLSAVPKRREPDEWDGTEVRWHCGDCDEIHSFIRGAGEAICPKRGVA